MKKKKKELQAQESEQVQISDYRERRERERRFFTDRLNLCAISALPTDQQIEQIDQVHAQEQSRTEIYNADDREVFSEISGKTPENAFENPLIEQSQKVGIEAEDHNQGEFWFLLPCQWIQSWHRFINDQPKGCGPPGPILNSSILRTKSNGTWIPRKGLVMGRDYWKVPPDVWYALREIYGGGPEIVRLDSGDIYSFDPLSDCKFNCSSQETISIGCNSSFGMMLYLI